MSVTLKLWQEPMPIGPPRTCASINDKPVSLGEYDHAQRALRLQQAFSTHDALAEFIHQQYRAAFKALHYREMGCNNEHDHGWTSCPEKRKAYFRRRAAWLMAIKPSFNGRTKESWR